MANSIPKWTDERTDTLTNLVGSESPVTQAMVSSTATALDTTTRSVSSKLRKMGFDVELASASHTKAFSDSEEATFLEMVSNNAFVEEIADALGKSINSVRGKALSFLRNGDISAIPAQKESRAASKVDALDAIGDITSMTIEQIAESIDKTARGVKTMLTRRGLTCSNYDGAKKAAKNAAKA